MAANRDRLALIEDISGIGSDLSADLRETLDRVAATIAAGIEVEVCSIYLFDAQRERLVLRATVGLERESVKPARKNTTRSWPCLSRKAAKSRSEY
jgi:signal transduction protein with GAF and PtsI domain